MMNEFIAIEDIQPVINYKRVIPTILMWNRLEGRPRTKNFDQALKAEVRDALFMLTKQWQMGEFKGDDAGSPVFAKVHMETTKLNKYKADGHVTQGFENNVPLETKVEQRKLPFKAGEQLLSLDIRLLMGRQWLKMTKSNFHTLKKDFIKAYPVNRPAPNKREDAQICAHQTAWQQYAAAAERAMDGAALYFQIKEEIGNHSYDLLAEAVKVTLTSNQKDIIEKIEKKFIAWFEKLFYQPIKENEDAWLPPKLEYQFACSAPKKGTEKVFTAEEYYHGHLDWYNLDVDKSRETLGNVEVNDTEPMELEKTHTYSFFPTQIQFDGMPNTRWWTFEEGKTNFGDIKPDTTDLNKLLLMEFGLVYANDWFLVPFTLPVGSVANVKGMAVTNVFGERIWVEPAGSGSDGDWQHWSMFTLNVNKTEDEPAEAADPTLLLLPTVPKIQESPPLEGILFIRDEMANMVWGIESRVLLPSGGTKPGREAAFEFKNHLKRIVEIENATIAKSVFGSENIVLKLLNEGILRNVENYPDRVRFDDSIIDEDQLRSCLEQIEGIQIDKILAIWRKVHDTEEAIGYKADIKYQIMSTVPENWIPFIPVHVKNNNREIQLQRAAMPRIIEGDREDPKKIRPRTILLSVGLDQEPKAAYKLFEEEVPRAGVRVYQSYQRTRWYGGRVYNWLGVRKQVGRGEGSSGLKFDQIVPTEKFKSQSE